MPTADEIDRAGAFYGPFDYGGGTAIIARWQSSTFEGRPIPPGRWYHLQSTDGVTSYGMIDASGGQFYAFPPYAVGVALGDVTDSMNDAIRALVAR